MTEESVRGFWDRLIDVINEWDANVPDCPDELAGMIIPLITSILPEERKCFETEASVLFADGWNGYRSALLAKLK